MPNRWTVKRGSGQRLGQLLAGGAAFRVLLEHIELGIIEAVVQETFEQAAVRAGFHPVPSSLRISCRIIFWTSLLAT